MKKIVFFTAVLAIITSVFCGCCQKQVPYYGFQFEVHDVNGNNIVGQNKRYHPDSISVYVDTTKIELTPSLNNKDSTYFFYGPFEGLDIYNDKPYIIRYNFIEKDTFFLTIAKENLKCYTAYELKHFKTRTQDEEIVNDRFVLIGKN
jgi:hypothetical protein